MTNVVDQEVPHLCATNDTASASGTGLLRGNDSFQSLEMTIGKREERGTGRQKHSTRTMTKRQFAYFISPAKVKIVA